MAIFNSYVSLPEGIHSLHIYTSWKVWILISYIETYSISLFDQNTRRYLAHKMIAQISPSEGTAGSIRFSKVYYKSSICIYIYTPACKRLNLWKTHQQSIIFRTGCTMDFHDFPNVFVCLPQGPGWKSPSNSSRIFQPRRWNVVKHNVFWWLHYIYIYIYITIYIHNVIHIYHI